MRYLLVVIFMLIAYYSLREPRKGSSGSKTVTAKENAPVTNDQFETSFEEGLPEEYAPTSAAHFSDIQKLKDDYEYRSTKLHRHFESEKKELRDSKEYSKEKMDELIEKQERAKEEYQKNYKIIRAEIENRIKEEKSSIDKGLR